MPLQIGRAFQDGVDELLSERGALFVAVFVLFGLANSVVWQSISRQFTEFIFASLPNTPESQQAMAGQASQLPFALDMPFAFVVVLALLGFVVAEALRILAIRAFASETSDPFPDEITADLGGTVLTAIFAAILTTVAVVLGSLLFVIPGLVLAFLFVFVRQEIALNDSGVFESISESIGLVSDNIIPLLVIVIVLGVLGIVITVPFQFLQFPLPAALTTTITIVLSQIITVFGIAVVTSAYQQATAERGDDEVEPVDAF